MIHTKHALLESLNTLPYFGIYLGLAGILTLGFLLAYSLITPYKELKLIREGNVAPALSLGGALLGFVIALSAVIRESVSPIDLIVWGVIALAVQLAAYLAVRLAIPDLVRGIKEGKVSHGAFLGIVSIAVGLLSGACVST